eukprot:2858025-Prymnesium_polylepis.1
MPLSCSAVLVPASSSAAQRGTACRATRRALSARGCQANAAAVTSTSIAAAAAAAARLAQLCKFRRIFTLIPGLIKKKATLRTEQKLPDCPTVFVRSAAYGP